MVSIILNCSLNFEYSYIIYLVPSGPPLNFSVLVVGTSLICSWSQPDESQANGVIVSYTLMCISGDVTVVDVTLNSTVFELVVDLFMHSTNYSCTVAASTAVGVGPTAPAVNITTEGILHNYYSCKYLISFFFVALELYDSYLQFIPLSVELDSITTVLPESDDGTSDAIFIPDGFPFGSSVQTQFYVCVYSMRPLHTHVLSLSL